MRKEEEEDSHLIDVETLATLKCGKHSTSARYSIDELS
jgi:hypothetical protein